LKWPLGKKIIFSEFLHWMKNSSAKVVPFSYVLVTFPMLLAIFKQGSRTKEKPYNLSTYKLYKWRPR